MGPGVEQPRPIGGNAGHRSPPRRYTLGGKITLAIGVLLVCVVMPWANDARLKREATGLRHVGALVPFTPPGGDFTILMPPGPIHDVEDYPAARVDGWTATASRSTAYAIHVRDFPAQPGPAALEMVGAGLQGMPGRQTFDDRFFRVGDTTCRRFRQTSPECRRIDNCLVLAGRRLYILTARTDDPAPNVADIERFFDSFKIIHPLQ